LLRKNGKNKDSQINPKPDDFLQENHSTAAAHGSREAFTDFMVREQTEKKGKKRNGKE
jgi:hypothetical protein